MKTIILGLVFLLPFTVMAETQYVREMKSLFAQMVDAKKTKNASICGSKGLPEIQRAATIRAALHTYSEAMDPLMEKEGLIREKFNSRISLQEESEVNGVREKMKAFLHEESAMEEAAREINMTAGQ